MAVNNSLARQDQSMKLSVYLQNDAVKKQINQVVGGKNGTRFISSIVSAVQSTPALQECTSPSIVNAALLGEALNLSPSPQLGQFYMVPFDNKKKGCKEAQFQLGYSVVIPAENKREKALELAKEGKGAAEIARLIDAKYSTVYSWLNPDKCKKPKPENKTASNADRHKCRTCMFRATGNTKGAGCSYIEITGHSRGCSVEECSVYQKGDAVSKRKMKGFYE